MDIPQIMMDVDRWLRWRLIPRGDRMSKLPITHRGKPAKSTDPDTWTRFERALTSQKGQGMGFALGEGFACIDLDDAITEDGRLEPWARRILAITPETFIEISQSGKGIHIWGLMPEAPGRNLRSKGLSVEIYSAGRFIALGSQEWLTSKPKLANLTGLANELVA